MNPMTNHNGQLDHPLVGTSKYSIYWCVRTCCYSFKDILTGEYGSPKYNLQDLKSRAKYQMGYQFTVCQVKIQTETGISDIKQNSQCNDEKI